MPNGTVQPQEFNATWCAEKHRRIDHDIDNIHARIDRVDGRLWALLIIAVVQLVGIVTMLVQAYNK